MRESPILFSAPMVRAILEGRKSQTRRVVKPQPFEGCGRIVCGTYYPCVVDRHGDEQPGEPVFGAYGDDGEWGVRCPYGQPGDRLWGRESFAWSEYACSHEEVVWRADREYTLEERGGQRWRPSIHMPRWASRIVLEISGIRVERLNDISEEDALAEGVFKKVDNCEFGNVVETPFGGEAIYMSRGQAKMTFAELWQSINGLQSWNANPWVWVVEFKRVQP